MRWLLPLLLAVPLSAQTPDSVRTFQSVHQDSTRLYYTVRRVDTLRQSLPSRAPSIPIGPYHASLALIGTTLTGTLRYGDPLNWKAQLDSVRGKGSIFFALFTDRKGFLATRADGKKIFDEARWRAVFDSVWASKPISPYLADGTIAAVYPFDEPNCGSCWGLDDSLGITPAQVDRLSGYIKAKWPYATIAIRVIPQWLVNTPNVDVAWAQYEGPHLPSNRMTAKQFADSNVRAAKARGLGLVLALNVLDGGDGSSKVNGTFFQDPNPLDSITKDARGNTYRYQMSPAEVLQIGQTFAAEPYACGVTGWKDDPAFRGAWAKIAQVQRVFTPCRRP